MKKGNISVVVGYGHTEVAAFTTTTVALKGKNLLKLISKKVQLAVFISD